MKVWDRTKIEKLLKGPASVDEKILTRLRMIANDRKMHPQGEVSALLQIYSDRYLNLSNLPTTSRSNLDPSDFASVRVLMRLATRYPNSRSFIYGRGPKFYTFLVEVAKSATPESKVARRYLVTTALSCRKKKDTGDPALIRIFRKSRDVFALGALRDRESIPLLRAQLKDTGPHDRYRRIKAVALMGDSGAVPLLLPFLATKEEVAMGPTDHFEIAASTLRQVAQPSNRPVLLNYIKSHSGYPRAFVINTLGYVGDKSDIAPLNAFANDPEPRVRRAVVNAISRIRGTLSKQRFSW